MIWMVRLLASAGKVACIALEAVLRTPTTAFGDEIKESLYPFEDLLDQFVAAMLRTIEVNKMGRVFDDDDFHAGGMDQMLLEQFSILDARPEVPFRGQYKRGSGDKGSIPKLPSGREIKTVFHRAARRSKACGLALVTGRIAFHRCIGVSLRYRRIAPLVLVLGGDATVPDSQTMTLPYSDDKHRTPGG